MFAYFSKFTATAISSLLTPFNAFALILAALLGDNNADIVNATGNETPAANSVLLVASSRYSKVPPAATPDKVCFAVSPIPNVWPLPVSFDAILGPAPTIPCGPTNPDIVSVYSPALDFGWYCVNLSTPGIFSKLAKVCS